MKKKVKKLTLKKQTLRLLNNPGLLGGHGLNESRNKICPIESINQCTSVTCPSYDTRCTTCNALM